MSAVEVTILKPDASSFLLEVDLARDTVYTLKGKIRDKDGTEIDIQRLEFDGTALESTSSLAFYNITAGSVIHFREGPLVISASVSGVGGQTLFFRLSPEATILDVKQAIHAELGVELAQIQLTSHGVEVPNASVLSEIPAYTHRDGISFRMDVRIIVTLRMPNGMQAAVEVGVNDDVSLLKNMAFIHCRIPPHLQCLAHDDVVLESRRRMGYYSIPNNATIDVSLRDFEMMVFLKTLTGQTITVRVTPRDTVADVKQKIFEQEGIPVDRQRMIFVGEQLNDNHRLLDYRIEHESAVHLVFRSGNFFQVFVRTANNRTMVFECQPTNTVSTMKRYIQEQEGLHTDIQELIFEDRVLSDEFTLRECGLQHNSVINLRLQQGRNTQIFVALPENDTLPIWVNCEHTVSVLKQQIAQRKNIPTDLQELFFARQRLEDDRTLESYTIEENHMLHLHVSTPITLELNIVLRSGKTLQLFELSTQTLSGVKQSIWLREGIMPEHQLIFHKGVELEDNQKRLRDYRMQNGDNLNVDSNAPITSTISSNSSATASVSKIKPRGLLLFVKTLTGKTITVNITAKDTIGDLKKKINEKEGIPINHQCLIAAGKSLADTDDINSIGVQNHSVLHLVLRVPSRVTLSFSIQTPSGENITVSSSSSDTVDRLKDIIESEHDQLVASQHKLLHNGTVLEGDKTLGSYRISDGDQLQLQKLE